jgi:hypothetical protein
MTKYKRNHTFPVSLLHYWASQPEKYLYSGVWVYEIDSKRKYFANAQGRSAYTFAVTNDVYIATIEGERATAMEQWLSGLEGTLADFASQAHKHQETLALEKQEDIEKVLAALFALEYRSPSIIGQLQATFASFDTRLQPDELLSHRLALENVINYVNECAKRFSLGTMLLFYCDQPCVLLSDRPTVSVGDQTLAPRFFVLTSKVIVALTQEMHGNGFVYSYAEPEQDILDKLNENIARQARMWIASTTESQLDQFIPIFDSDEWKEYRNSNRTRPAFELRNGWEIPPDDERHR